MELTHIQAPNGRAVRVPTGLFINGAFVPGKTGSTIDVRNPLNEELLAKLASAQKADVDIAVNAAAAALKGWRTVSAIQRGNLLNRLADLIEQRAEDFATIEAIDAGILYNDSLRGHVKHAANTLQYYARLAGQNTGDALEIPNGFAYTRREPFGICAAIIPWNAPLMITCWKLGPAIASGNVLIIKTPELAPLYGQKLAQLVVEAGFPPGVVNLLCGLGQETGQALAEHMLIRKVAFTGSDSTGRSILRAAANTNLKKVTLELGGKGPGLIFPDADLKNAAFWASLGSSANNGQICALMSRLYVHESVYDEFLGLFKEQSQAPVRHGDPTNLEVSKGPVVSLGQYERIMSYIEKGREEGATVLFGGHSTGTGNFVPHTAFVNVTEGMSIVKEEIFGPVVTISKFSSEEDAIKKANDSEYGLAAYVFTSDIACAMRVSDALEVGQVSVNCWSLINVNVPFGGVKQSGFGRDMGREALDDWTIVKSVQYWTSGSVRAKQAL
ncbi:aldehyde dehydrogenase [Thelonectria olida]|uniref:aldehyde dehydrogenase (NAD(+)) n=1 Tax=Thelonectria olida TaxID=1576542 RepID=A0A9P8VYI4_9HYPO|nr:aldehyde dehydrogenase [Thelonectria olida]